VQGKWEGRGRGKEGMEGRGGREGTPRKNPGYGPGNCIVNAACVHFSFT